MRSPLNRFTNERSPAHRPEIVTDRGQLETAGPLVPELVQVTALPVRRQPSVPQKYGITGLSATSSTPRVRSVKKRLATSITTRPMEWLRPARSCRGFVPHPAQLGDFVLHPISGGVGHLFRAVQHVGDGSDGHSGHTATSFMLVLRVLTVTPESLWPSRVEGHTGVKTFHTSVRPPGRVKVQSNRKGAGRTPCADAKETVLPGFLHLPDSSSALSWRGSWIRRESGTIRRIRVISAGGWAV